VIEGTWYVGEGAKFDAAKLKSYPAGSFVVIPANVPHFVEAKGAVVVQLTGIRKWQTDYLEINLFLNPCKVRVADHPPRLPRSAWFYQLNSTCLAVRSILIDQNSSRR